MSEKKSRATKINQILKTIYPHVKTQLCYKNPFELLVATILSAQCTDAQVNRVTPVLFEQLAAPKDFAKAPLEQIEKIIHNKDYTNIYTNVSCNHPTIRRLSTKPDCGSIWR